MRILCQHGYYRLYSETKADIVDFTKYVGNGVSFTAVEDYYTFPALVGAKDYSINATSYLNLVSSKNFEGKIWDVMKENKFVFSVSLNKLVPLAAVTDNANISLCDGYYVSKNPLLQAGSRDASGAQILGFDGIFSMIDLLLYIRALKYE